MSRVKPGLWLFSCVVALMGLQGIASAQARDTTPQPNAPMAERLRRETDNDAIQKVPPFKAFDNLYYVGVGSVASWLITTSDGLILIDALDGRYADHLLDNIRKVGQDPRNVKYVIVTQAHFDHFGAAATLQDMYGTRIAMGEADWAPAIEAGTRPNARAKAPRRDISLKDGETLTLGDTTLKFIATPGHSPGTTSVEFTVFDRGKPRRAMFIGGVAPAAGMGPGQQAMASLAKLDKMQEGIEVRLVTHPWMDPNFWERAERLKARKPGEPHPLVSAQVFKQYLQDLRAQMTKNLEDTRAKEAAGTRP